MQLVAVSLSSTLATQSSRNHARSTRTQIHNDGGIAVYKIFHLFSQPQVYRKPLALAPVSSQHLSIVL